MSVSEFDHAVLKEAMTLRPLVVSYVYGMLGSYELAEDAYQDTIVVICQKTHNGLDDIRNVKAWVFEIARRTALALIRKQSKKPEICLANDTMDAIFAAASLNGLDNQEVNEMSSALCLCVAKLSDKARRLLHIRYEQGRSCEDVSQELGRPVASVYVSLTRIRKSLRDCIHKHALDVKTLGGGS